MPRQKSLVTVIREMVQSEVSSAVQRLLAGLTGKSRKTRRRRKRGRRGPGRPPGAKTRRRRGRPAATA